MAISPPIHCSSRLLCCVYGQLVCVTRTLASVQFGNETHQFSNGHCGNGSHFELRVCVYVCVCVEKLGLLFSARGAASGKGAQ